MAYSLIPKQSSSLLWMDVPRRWCNVWWCANKTEMVGDIRVEGFTGDLHASFGGSVFFFGELKQRKDFSKGGRKITSQHHPPFSAQLFSMGVTSNSCKKRHFLKKHGRISGEISRPQQNMALPKADVFWFMLRLGVGSSKVFSLGSGNYRFYLILQGAAMYLSNEKNPGCLGYIGSYYTVIYMGIF